MSTNEDIEAVVAELRRAWPTGGGRTQFEQAATRLILEARRERDELQTEHDAHNTAATQYEADIRRLTAERDAALARIERREKEWTRRYEELEAAGAANARLRAEFEAVCERGIGGYGPACHDLEAHLRAALDEPPTR